MRFWNRFLIVTPWALGSIALTGCQRDRETVFAAGLEPLAENQAPWPGDGEGRPEQIALVDVGAPDWSEVHARAYVHGPFAATREALTDPEVGVDRRVVNEWSVTMDVEPAYEISYRVHTVVRDIVTVEYDLTWRHGLPEEGVGAVRWQKTDGSSLIERVEGSIVIREVEDEITSLEIVERLQAPGEDAERVISFLNDLFASVVARVRGEPLPVW